MSKTATAIQLHSSFLKLILYLCLLLHFMEILSSLCATVPFLQDFLLVIIYQCYNKQCAHRFGTADVQSHFLFYKVL